MDKPTKSFLGRNKKKKKNTKHTHTHTHTPGACFQLFKQSLPGFLQNLKEEDLCLAVALTYIPGTGLYPLIHTPENSNSSQLELPAI